ncbi:MAG TPA: hypothetical protein VF808_18480 [Ktedonobacterales bacterium]
MNDAQAPLARVRLIDGRELVIWPDAARVGERVHLLSRISEARLLFLQPETIGLRMADIGLAEYSVARPGDGQMALNAIYSLRPDLRRADAPAPAPAPPPGYLVTPPAPEAVWPGIAPRAYGVAGMEAGAFPAPPPGAYPYPAYQPPPEPRALPFPPQVAQAYGPQPERRYATLTPAPRAARQLIGATFQLVRQRFGPLLSAAVLFALLPNLILGALAVVVTVTSGQSPWAPASNPLTAQAPSATQPAPSDMAQALTLITLILGVLFTGWSVAALTLVARDLTLGRPVAIWARALEGAQRLWPVISTLIIQYVVLLSVAVPGLGFAGGLITVALQPPAGMPPITSTEAAIIIALGVGLGVATLALLAWLWPRVALAPTAAALGLAAPFRTAWGLARGGGWRILWTLLVIGALTTALTLPAALSEYALPSAVAAVALIPLGELISAPLNALARTLALYDQRLRREGYALFLQEGVTPPAPTQPVAPDHAAEPR